MFAVTAIGNLGRDPEVKYFENGSMITQFNLAVKTGKDNTEWINAKIWGKLGQLAIDYLKKGSLVAVSGSLETERWTDKKTGEERSKLVVNVRDLKLLGAKGGGGGGSKSRPLAKREEEDFDDEVPF